MQQDPMLVQSAEDSQIAHNTALTVWKNLVKKLIINQKITFIYLVCVPLHVHVCMYVHMYMYVHVHMHEPWQIWKSEDNL